ncbi:hypothetical protein B566_EDAN002829 [Ephemera danica]|nr:hypothetical protein B566_EDAN002829 [Ephemera danica]
MEGYSSDSSDGDVSTTLDLSHLQMVTSKLQQHFELLLETNKNTADVTETLLLFSNNLLDLPASILQFHSLKVVDLSCNGLTLMASILTQCSLTSLILKNNNLDSDSFPKSFGLLESSLKELNLSGNRLTTMPEQILELKCLKYLYLGSNRISEISKDIKKLMRQPFSQWNSRNGGKNNFTRGRVEVIVTLITHNYSIFMCRLPSINIKLGYPLRDNPLVVRFVREMTHQPPASLLELAARAVQTHRVHYGPGDLPASLLEYLGSAHHCVNPQCQGVFFDNRVEHIKFVDFCGKYRVPLLQYLCSERCASTEASGPDLEEAPPGSDLLLRKVLLG